MGAWACLCLATTRTDPCKCMAIGARSQSARTYLEKHLEKFATCDLDELVKHGLRALRDTLPNEVDLSNRNVTVAIVGKTRDFTVYEDADVDAFLAGIENEERRGGGGGGVGGNDDDAGDDDQAAPGGDAAAAMETDS